MTKKINKNNTEREEMLAELIKRSEKTKAFIESANFRLEELEIKGEKIEIEDGLKRIRLAKKILSEVKDSSS